MAEPTGIFNVSLTDDIFESSPTWTRVDEDYTVQSYDIRRGRSFELDHTDTGIATVNIIDRDGAWDPTNSAGAFYGLGPMAQAAICLQNPTDSSWETRIKGFITSVSWEPWLSMEKANVRVEIADAFALFAACEMMPDGNWGDQVTSGNIVFDADTATTAVQTRLGALLDSFGWSAGLRNLFTGNVKLQRKVYAPQTSMLSAMFDAADSEFAGVSNLYMSREGYVRFRGRLAKFNYTDPTYGITVWEAGDNAAAVAAPATVVRLSPPMQVSVDDTNIYTAAIATPENIADADIPAQYVEDATAKGIYGRRTWSAENLGVGGGASSTTALYQTALMSQYIVDNYAYPKTRVGALTVRPKDPNGVHGDATWALMCGVEISDVVELTTTHGGGGGFSAEPFFVEGIREVCRPMNATHADNTLTLDVSPVSYFNSNPF